MSIYFSAHVTAFLGSSSLILKMNACGSRLYEKLGEFHGGSESSKASISITYQRRKIVYIRSGDKLLIGHNASFVVLPAVLHSEHFDELVALVWYCWWRIVCEIGPRFISGGGRGRALPTWNVDRSEVFCRVGDLDRVECAISKGKSIDIMVREVRLIGFAFLNEFPEFFAHLMWERFKFNWAYHGCDLASSVGSVAILESRCVEPSVIVNERIIVTSEFR